jgi:sulfoxide reductase heme-binding subunit YedZ
MPRRFKLQFTPFQILVHLGALLPLALLLWDIARGNLLGDPVRSVIVRTGDVAMIILMLSLAVTPIFIVTGIKQVRKVRRALGLYAFLYVMLHVLAYAGLDYGWDFYLIGLDILDRRAAQAGVAAFLIFIPLAVTSTKGWQKRLKKAWIRLHKFVYAAAVLVMLHYIWVQKSDITTPLAWSALLLLLFIVRIPAIRKAFTQRRSRRIAARQRPTPVQVRSTHTLEG